MVSFRLAFDQQARDFIYTHINKTQETLHYLNAKSQRSGHLENTNCRDLTSQNKVTTLVKKEQKEDLPGFAEHQCILSDSSRTQSFMSWIRCSDLLKRVHLLLISCSRSDHCGRSIFRSFPTYNVNQTHKHRFTYCSLKNSGEIGRQQKESSKRAPSSAGLLYHIFRSLTLSITG